MEIFSACPFAVSTLAWEPAPGRRSLCVIVKATFVLAAAGPSTLAALQEPIDAEARDGEPGPSLGELVPFKPRAEVLLSGHAHAPRGAPIDSLIARARVGAFRKALSITGDRTWVPSFDGLRPSVAVPFRRMPLRYERAVRTGENLGGVDVLSQGAELGRALANIAAIADQGGETPGFGPVPLTWRARRCGLPDAAVLWAARVALSPGPPPAGFDFRVFNAAPPEQQLEEIPPGVEIQLDHLHPEHARVDTRLPVLRVKLFRRAPRADRTVELSARCDTLAIDTDRGLCFATWRGAVLLDGPDESSVGRLVIAAEHEGDRVGPEQVDRLLGRLSPPVTYLDPVAFAVDPAAAGMHAPASEPSEPGSYPPPVPPPAGPAPAELVDDPTPPPPPPAPEARRERNTLTPAAAVMALAPAAAALPFRAPPTGFGVPSEPSPPSFGPRDSYPPPPPPRAASAPPTSAPPPPRAPSFAPHDEDDGEMTPPRGYPPFPFAAASPPTPTPAPERTATGTLRPPASAPPPVGVVERTASGTLRPPPSVAAVLPFAAPGPLPSPPPPTPRPPTPPPPAPAWSEFGLAAGALSLATYAAVKGEVWRTGAPLAEVLERHGVDEAAFRAHEREQAEVLAQDAAAGHADRALAVLAALRAARAG